MSHTVTFSTCVRRFIITLHRSVDIWHAVPMHLHYPDEVQPRGNTLGAFSRAAGPIHGRIGAQLATQGDLTRTQHATGVGKVCSFISFKSYTMGFYANYFIIGLNN